jgi:two-component system cell cycle sensor histidine kinase/response regulator CckA
VVYDWDIVADTHFWGETLHSAFGYEPDRIELDNRWWADRIHPDDAPKTMASLRCALAGDATSWSEEYRFRRSDDSYATVLDRGYLVRDGQGLAVRLIGSMTDLTDRKRLEAQLRQSQKLEAVGRLAGGVAHDFNNLLQVIQSYGGFVAAELPPDAVARADIDEVLKAASRAQALTGQLLAFGRKQVLQPRLLDVNDTVTDVAGMLRRVIGEDIALLTDLCATLWPVHADPGQLTQVLMNLVVNARDAMPEGGTLRVSTAAVTLGRSDARARSGLEPGQYVAVAVEDTGVGIDPAVLPQIFEPFFTTKGPGRGTGLGLATAHGIIEQSGGSITVDSTPGSGSRFTVLLPRAYGPIDAERTLPPPNPLPRGNETILLVEDEPAVRTVVQRMLERQGYVVLVAGDGAEALQVAEQARDGIALVLTDVVMPGQRAPALTQQLVARWPAMRVLYMSGYADDEILRRGLTQSGAAFLEKPFTPESLAAAVRRVLDGAAPPRTT